MMCCIETLFEMFKIKIKQKHLNISFMFLGLDHIEMFHSAGYQSKTTVNYFYEDDCLLR